MLSIRSSADLQRTLDTAALDPPLRTLLALRRDQLTAGTHLDLGEMAHFMVVQPGDTLPAVEAEAGLPMGTNLVDGTRLGERGFVPSFEWVARHGCWLEAVTVLNDDGFALVLFAADCIHTDPKVLSLLRAGSAVPHDR